MKIMSTIKKLPLSTILVALILAIGLILFVGAYSKRDAFSKINIFTGRETVIDPQNKDTDNDGLKDWEEELYKTDPLNPDTDADGYLDGEEINSDHNPLVKGPGDKLAFYPLPVGDKYNITKKVLADDIIESLLKSYLSQKQEYIKDHPEIDDSDKFLTSVKESTIIEFSQRALLEIYPLMMEKGEKILSEIPELFRIEINDDQIKISENNTPEEINAYFSKISSIITDEDFLFRAKNIKIMLKAFEDGDFSELDNYIKTNDAKIGQLKEIIAPSSWKEVHKELLRLAILTRNIFVSLRGAGDDFIKAQFATQELELLPEKWNNLMEEILNINK